MSVQSTSPESTCDSYDLRGEARATVPISQVINERSTLWLPIAAKPLWSLLRCSLALEVLPCLLTRLKESAESELRAELDLRCKMTDKCAKCGRTESQITSDVKALGLQQEFQCGVYTCCQIAAWADEQWLAWFEATQEDSSLVDNMTARAQVEEDDCEGVLVPVRLRRRQVPWYKHP